MPKVDNSSQKTIAKIANTAILRWFSALYRLCCWFL